MMLVLLVIGVGLLALANGSNDNGKGVAALVGVGLARPAGAMLFATLATAAGGAVSLWAAGGLLKGFGGGWLFAAGATPDAPFYVAALAGACGWVLLASRTGMPVSTTHAIVGALCGAGLVAFGGASVQWSALGARFAMPLAVSPVASLAAVYVLAFPVSWLATRLGGRCVCLVERAPAVAVAAAASGAPGTIAFTAGAAPGPAPGAAAPSVPALVTGTEASCARAGDVAAAVTVSSAARALHWLSAGLISFARGWNDTPKIAALGLLALAGWPHGTPLAFVIVTLAMAAGGIVAGRRVLETMAKKLTPLPPAESLTAGLTTAALVALASWRGLPVSTTHVATGAIVGAGLKNDPRSVRWGKVGEVVLSWAVTLPVAALIAAAARWALR